MTFNNTNGKLFPAGPGGWNQDPANVIIVAAAPSTAAVENRIGTLAIVPSTGTVYCCSNNTGLNGTVTWTALGGGASAIATINSNAPVAGDYVLAGTANQITVAETAGTSTFTLPAVVTAPGSVTATTTLTATLGNITATNGNLVLGTAGNKLSIATGANASVGTSAAMTAGTIQIATTAVTASSLIYLSHNTLGGTAGALSAPTASIVAGTSFDIISSSNTDTSTVNWMIIN